MMGLLRDTFPDATVITIDNDPAIAAFHRRHLTLVRTDHIVHLAEKSIDRAEPAPTA